MYETCDWTLASRGPISKHARRVGPAAKPHQGLVNLLQGPRDGGPCLFLRYAEVFWAASCLLAVCKIRDQLNEPQLCVLPMENAAWLHWPLFSALCRKGAVRLQLIYARHLCQGGSAAHPMFHAMMRLVTETKGFMMLIHDQVTVSKKRRKAILMEFKAGTTQDLRSWLTDGTGEWHVGTKVNWNSGGLLACLVAGRNALTSSDTEIRAGGVCSGRVEGPPLPLPSLPSLMLLYHLTPRFQWACTQGEHTVRGVLNLINHYTENIPGTPTNLEILQAVCGLWPSTSLSDYRSTSGPGAVAITTDPGYTPAAGFSAETQMAEFKTADRSREEPLIPLPSVERWKKFHCQPLEDQLEFCDFHPRVDLSDNLKVGYFATDRATQTDVSEVLELRQLSYTTQKLAKLTDVLQQDFKYLKLYLEMQFKDQLKEESMKLYQKLQMIIQEVVNLHEKNEDTMRKSFYKQLCDAIASIKGTYSQFFSVDEDLSKMPTVSMKIFKQRILEKNDLIRELQEQLVGCKEHEWRRWESILDESTEKMAYLGREISDLRKENERLTKLISGLEEDVQLCEKSNTLLEGELAGLKQKMQRDQKIIQKLTLMKEHLSEILEEEKKAILDMYDIQKEDLEETRLFLETESSESTKDDLIREEVEEAKSLEDQESFIIKDEDVSPEETIKSIYDEKPLIRRAAMLPQPRALMKKLPAIPASLMREKVPSLDKVESIRAEKEDIIWRESEDNKRPLEYQVAKLKRISEMQKKYIKCIQMESDQEIKLWERKYLILRKSYHALKNEMFTRQSMLRQYVTLSETSFNYNKAKPLYIQPKQNQPVKEKSFQSTVLSRPDGSSHSQSSEDYYLSMPTTSREVISEEEEDREIEFR
ncbi:uncharacterized protein C10orf67 homolog, mitochondrial [Sminthopsis crassicaudata]|uniref:uncharacterized protein C10orf67 homolog, mitochondrial n=1 Tax=Sminthopsis crassicaudata TaxID=9301 RepID=UPI003D6902C9